jgi:hypothetical protein
MRWGMTTGWRLLALLALLVGATPAEAGEAIHVQLTPVPLEANSDRDRIGRLIYRGGFALSSPDARFGGLSDLSLDAEGRRLLAISDRGGWFSAELRYDARGWLEGLADASLGTLIGPSGRKLRGLAGDAEGMAVYPDGSILVGFERQHRLWLYPPAEPPFARPPRPVPNPKRAKEMPANGGFEALLRLSGGRLFALSEELQDGPEHVGWIGDGITWDELRWRTTSDFKPTGMAQFPPGTVRAGDVLVLERRYTVIDGPGARISLLPRSVIRPGARLNGEELAVIRQPLAIDNFEGIAIARGPRGQSLVYLLSDDNFSFWQRTLLLMFELSEEPK